MQWFSWFLELLIYQIFKKTKSNLLFVHTAYAYLGSQIVEYVSGDFPGTIKVHHLRKTCGGKILPLPQVAVWQRFGHLEDLKPYLWSCFVASLVIPSRVDHRIRFKRFEQSGCRRFRFFMPFLYMHM